VRYNKLVRDLVPGTLQASGRKVVTRFIVGEELQRALRAAIDDVVTKFDTAQDDDHATSTMADLVENATRSAMARQRGCSENRIMQLRASRSAQLGVYDRGIFLVEME
jgi:predicted house-cleaning noncanonical NTP pyrophosphatase (MazG superfamily)